MKMTNGQFDERQGQGLKGYDAGEAEELKIVLLMQEGLVRNWEFRLKALKWNREKARRMIDEGKELLVKLDEDEKALPGRIVGGQEAIEQMKERMKELKVKVKPESQGILRERVVELMGEGKVKEAFKLMERIRK